MILSPIEVSDYISDSGESGDGVILHCEYQCTAMQVSIIANKSGDS